MPETDKELIHKFGNKEFGAWMLEIMPGGTQELKKKIVVARSLLDAIRANPDTMHATFLAEGEFVLGVTPGEE